MAWAYVLWSEQAKRSYTGSTDDLKRRLTEHNAGKTASTKRHVPWNVIYSEEVADLRAARAREKYLKSAAGRKYLKRLDIYSPVAQR